MASKSGDVAERLEQLEERVRSLSESRSAGGMLSSADFRKLVVAKEREAGDYDGLKKAFLNREWDKVDRRFIINPYDELNLTPFSYDLSLGDEIFSVRKRDRLRKRLPYKFEPGETVILLTREFIALPACYSATVWPRFNLVRDGIFQSMVKIDPTWYGRLGVAVNNLSPRTIELEEGMAFGTLVLYGLSSDTDIDLLQPSELPEIRVDIPDLPVRPRLDEKLGSLKLKNVCWVEGNQLVIKGLKRSSYEKLLRIDPSGPWQKVCEDARNKWLSSSGEGTTRRRIGMEALGMSSLEKLVEGAPMGDSLGIDQLRGQIVSQDVLHEMALEWGKTL